MRIFCRGHGRAKACARAAEPKSRALETDASGLNGRPHGVWGSSAVFARWRSRTNGWFGIELRQEEPPRNDQSLPARNVFYAVYHFSKRPQIFLERFAV